MNLPPSAGAAQDVGLIPGSERSPEEEMATHSSILAWEIPWTEGPGRLEPIGSQRVRHVWIHTHRRDICPRSGFKMSEIIYVKHCMLWMFKSI